MLTIIPHPDAQRANVRDVQRALIAAGYDPGKVDGVTGPRTRLAWDRWFAERTKHLGEDPGGLAVRIALADAVLLLRRGDRQVDVLVKLGGGESSAQAYCAFAAAGWLRGGAKWAGGRLLSRTSGGVVKWWHRLTQDERIPAAAVRECPGLLRAGDVFFRTRTPGDVARALDGGTPVGHAGLVERVESGVVWTVEGNTNDGDSATGGRIVAKAVLRLDDPRLLGFGRMRFG